MKKVFCILLTALVLFGAMGLHAFAASSTVTRDISGINMEKGDVMKIHYQDLYEHSNKAVPKGGHLEWYWGYLGGKGEFSTSKDHKYCTVRAARPGVFALGCEVYNAKGEKISDDAIIFYVSSPAYRAVNIMTIGLYGSARTIFWQLMTKLMLLPIHDIA